MLKKRKVYQSRFTNPRVLANRKRSVKKDSNFTKIFKAFLKIVFLAVIIFCVYYIFNNDYLKIDKINNKSVSDFSQKIDDITKNELSSKKILFLANSNFLLFSAPNLENAIMNGIPEIKTVKVIKKFPNTIEIETSLHEATMGWETQDKKYLLNEEGYILKETDNFTNFIFVKDSTNLPLKKEEQVVYPNFINFCKQINDKVASLGIKIQYLDIKETTFIVNAYTENGYKIIFNTTKSIEDQINKLKETIIFLGPNLNKLEYVDVTVKNKAIYKLK